MFSTIEWLALRRVNHACNLRALACSRLTRRLHSTHHFLMGL